jgi:hypothetical protein
MDRSRVNRRQAGAGTEHPHYGRASPHPSWRAHRLRMVHPGRKKASANIAFQDLTATIELHLEGAKPYTQQFTFPNPRIAVLDNNMYHQYAVLAHLYDWQKKGPQIVSVLVPQSMTPGSVTMEPLASASAGNPSQQALSVKTEDLEVDVFLESGKLQRIAVPARAPKSFAKIKFPSGNAASGGAAPNRRKPARRAARRVFFRRW